MFFSFQLPFKLLSHLYFERYKLLKVAYETPQPRKINIMRLIIDVENSTRTNADASWCQTLPPLCEGAGTQTKATWDTFLTIHFQVFVFRLSGRPLKLENGSFSTTLRTKIKKTKGSSKGSVHYWLWGLEEWSPSPLLDLTTFSSCPCNLECIAGTCFVYKPTFWVYMVERQRGKTLESLQQNYCFIIADYMQTLI